jgi:hypothetical protein
MSAYLPRDAGDELPAALVRVRNAVARELDAQLGLRGEVIILADVCEVAHAVAVRLGGEFRIRPAPSWQHSQLCDDLFSLDSATFYASPDGILAGMATHWTLGCDAADPQKIAAFWATALGYVTEPGYDDPDGASIIDPDGVGPAIGFLRVPEGKTAKNRMHIDIRVAGEPPWDMAEREQLIRAKAAELVGAGATFVREDFYGEDFGHIVMFDPEGNEFCVA